MAPASSVQYLSEWRVGNEIYRQVLKQGLKVILGSVVSHPRGMHERWECHQPKDPPAEWLEATVLNPRPPVPNPFC